MLRSLGYNKIKFMIMCFTYVHQKTGLDTFFNQFLYIIENVEASGSELIMSMFAQGNFFNT